jgi:membrane dipeptidase
MKKPSTFTYERMVKGEVRIQTLSIFVSRNYIGNRWEAMLEQAAYFHAFCNQFNVEPLVSKCQLNPLLKRSAILTVEGLDDVPADEEALNMLYALGVRALSLTWNGSNSAADGALSSLHKGLTEWGRRVVQWCNEKHVAIDASHLSESSFWDVLTQSKKPIYCSHSNANSVWNHPRNLSDNQIQAVIQNDGIIGLTFVPAFLNRLNVSGIKDVIENIYRICELGGEGHISFGSDFDGVDLGLKDIEHPGKWQGLVRMLSNHFPYTFIENIAFHNAFRFFYNALY